MDITCLWVKNVIIAECFRQIQTQRPSSVVHTRDNSQSVTCRLLFSSKCNECVSNISLGSNSLTDLTLSVLTALQLHIMTRNHKRIIIETKLKRSVSPLVRPTVKNNPQNNDSEWEGFRKTRSWDWCGGKKLFCNFKFLAKHSSCTSQILYLKE